MTEALTRFQDAVRDLALEMVGWVILREVEHRLDKLRAISPPQRPRQRTRQRAAVVKSSTKSKAKAPLEFEPPVERDQPKALKQGWTRETIVSELATWLASGTAIDASFLKRHGPRGLVAAAKKTFGRFEAALNVASLHLSTMYPDGPPSRLGFAT
ncbi:MAG: hypothetical protein QM831_22075 [Kofleriaceae bacterium]